MISNKDNEEKLEIAEALLGFSTFPGGLRSVSEREFSAAFLIYTSSKFDLLPELAALGIDFQKLLMLLYGFAGQILAIPDQKTIMSGIRDITIYYSLLQSPTTAEIQRLAMKYETTPQTVRTIAESVSKTLSKPNPLKA